MAGEEFALKIGYMATVEGGMHVHLFSAKDARVDSILCWAAWPNLNFARKRTWVHVQQIAYHLPYILRLNLPGIVRIGDMVVKVR